MMAKCSETANNKLKKLNIEGVKFGNWSEGVNAKIFVDNIKNANYVIAVIGAKNLSLNNVEEIGDGNIHAFCLYKNNGKWFIHHSYAQLFDIKDDEFIIETLICGNNEDLKPYIRRVFCNEKTPNTYPNGDTFYYRINE
jgi:hypothetical protein